jgi:outer membrane receptor protein involved in Fe transport
MSWMACNCCSTARPTPPSPASKARCASALTRNLGVTLFGDTVRAKLDGGGLLPRIPATRAGVRLDANWNAWEGQVEWVQVARQNRVAEFETATPGYGMLNLGVSYNGKLANGTPWQVYVKGNNLTDRLAYAHTSFIKTAAPLDGAQYHRGGEGGVLSQKNPPTVVGLPILYFKEK